MFSKMDLKHFSTFTNARILIPTGASALSLDCSIKIEDPPFIHVDYPEALLRAEEVDRLGTCVLSCESGGTVYSIKGQVEDIPEGGRMLLKALEVSNPPQQRRFFRIDADVYMRFWLVDEERDEDHPPKAVMKKVNLSGCGVRFSTPDPMEVDQSVLLQLSFPDPFGGSAEAVGRVVRVFSRGKARQEVALDLVEIDAEEQEKLIRFCLTEQRRQLRFNIKVQRAGS